MQLLTVTFNKVTGAVVVLVCVVTVDKLVVETIVVVVDIHELFEQFGATKITETGNVKLTGTTVVGGITVDETVGEVFILKEVV